MKTYIGDNTGPGPQTVTVKVVNLVEQESVTRREYELPLKPSLKLWNHSPDGFQWGSPGSGTAQLALAILLDLLKDKGVAVTLHEEFQRRFIDSAGTHLVITEPEIRVWLKG